MKYIIMAGGPATRWKNYQNTTKHLIKIGNENLLERMVRQLKENNAEEIFIVADNELYEIEGSTRLPLIYEYKLYNMFYYKYLNEPCVFLYGDTWYTDETIKEIVNAKTDNVAFIGTNESVVGIKVIDCDLFRNLIDELKEQNINRAGWTLYRKINKIETEEFIKCDNFIEVSEDSVINVNDEEDFNQLLQHIIILLIKNQSKNSEVK